MVGRIVTATVAGLALMLIAGCGEGGASRKPFGGDKDADKKIKANEASAARSCLLTYVKEALVVRESQLAAVSGPLDKAKNELRALERDKQEIETGGGDRGRLPEVTQLLAAARKRLDGLEPQMGPKVYPLKSGIRRLNSLRKALSGGGLVASARFYSVLSHEVEPFNEKQPDRRTSKIRLKPVSFTDVMGSKPLEFKLTWRRAVRSNKYTRRNPKVNYELGQVTLLSGGTKDENPAEVKRDASGSIDEIRGE